MAARRFKGEESAASGMLAFLIAGVIFMGSIGAVLFASHNAGKGVAASEAPAATEAVSAQSLAKVLLGSPGYGSGSQDWVPNNAVGTADQGVESLKRLGLQDGTSTDPLMMSFPKFENLRLAPFAAAADGHVNYPEARHDLGLDQGGLNFHIRAYPTLPTMVQLLEQNKKEANLKVAYIGHATESAGAPPSDPGAGLLVGAISCTASPLPNAYRISSTITNKGTTPTFFYGVFGATFSTGDFATNNVRTPLLAPDASAPLVLDVLSYGPSTTQHRICGTNSHITLTVKDANLITLRTSTVVSACPTCDKVIAAGETANVAFTPKDLYIDSTPSTPLPGQVLTVTYNGNANGLAQNDPLTLKLYAGTDETGTPVSFVCSTAASASTACAISAAKKSSDRVVTVTLPATPNPSQYALYMYAANAASITSSTVRARTLVYASDPRPGGYSAAFTEGDPTYTAGGTVSNEVAMLDTIVHRFCPTYADSKVKAPLQPSSYVDPNALASGSYWTDRCADFKGTTPATLLQGDILPDSGTSKLSDLVQARLLVGGVPSLENTEVLVVGSNVDHSDMSPAGVKKTIGDWVDAGGTLIVFGSNGQSDTWLESVCHAKTESSNNGLSAPDTSNPILNTPNVLDWTNYDNFNQAWDIKKDDCGFFTPVVVSGSATDPQPVLTVSNPGSYGNGNLILTTWRGYDAYGTTDTPVHHATDAQSDYLEGLKLMHNLLMQGYRGLFLDYGPTLPANTNVVPAVRTVEIEHPNFGVIQMSIVIYVFK